MTINNSSALFQCQNQCKPPVIEVTVNCIGYASFISSINSFWGYTDFFEYAKYFTCALELCQSLNAAHRRNIFILGTSLIISQGSIYLTFIQRANSHDAKKRWPIKGPDTSVQQNVLQTCASFLLM